MKSVCVQSYGGKSIALLFLSFLLLYSIPIYTQNTGLTKNKLNTKENFEERDFSFYEKLLEYDNEKKQSTDSNLTLLSTFNMGPCYDAVPSGNYLYAGNGPLFQVFDITDLDKPVLVGEVLSQGQVRDIELYGEYAIFISPFTVVDISDPSNPTIVFTENYYALWELYISDNYAYVSSYASVHIIDIKDPRAPEYLSTVYTFGQFIGSIASKGNYLYISDMYFISVFNIEDKSNPYFLEDYFGGGGGLCAVNNFLYSAVNSGFIIYDITDPSLPVYLNHILINGLSEDLTIHGSLAFISQGSRDSSGLAILYVGDPLNLPEPLYISSKNSPLGYFKCEIQNNIAYIPSAVGFDIYSIEDPFSPMYLGSSLYAYWFWKMKIRNDLLYAMTAAGGLKIFDYADIYNLKILGEYQQKRIIHDFEISGDYVYLLSENAIEVLNIERKDSIYKINELIIPDPLYYENHGSIIIKDSILIASIPKYQMKLINITYPYNIYITDSLATGRRVHDMALKDDYLISAEPLEGIKVYKISSPPYLVNFIESIGSAVLIDNDILYADRLRIYDITNPELLIFLGETFTPGSSSSVEIDKSGQYVILAFNQSVEVIDVSDPYNPFIAAYSRGVSYPSIAAHGNLIFAGYQQNGIKVFKNDLMTSINDYKNSSEPEETIYSYPNPFNSNTIITYKIKNSSFVRINIYDLLGRKIETLENNWKEGGEHKVIFNSKDLASGVYFCSLQIDDEVIKTIKLQLIK